MEEAARRQEEEDQRRVAESRLLEEQRKAAEAFATLWIVFFAEGAAARPTDPSNDVCEDIEMKISSAASNFFEIVTSMEFVSVRTRSSNASLVVSNSRRRSADISVCTCMSRDSAATAVALNSARRAADIVCCRLPIAA